MIFVFQIGLLVLFISYYIKNRVHFTGIVSLLLVAKIVAGCSFIYLYQVFFEGDLTTYIQLSKEWNALGDDLSLVLHNKGVDPHILAFRPRQLLFGKVFYLVYKVSWFNIYLSSLVFSLVSFPWILECIKIVKKHSFVRLEGFLLALFVPSILFWSSGITKEMLCFPAFLYFVFSMYDYFNDKINWRSFPFVVLSFLLVFNLRYFYVPLLLILFLSYLIPFYYKKILFWAVVLGGAVAYLVFQEVLIPQLQTKYIHMLIHNNYHMMALKGGEGITIDFKDDSTWSILKAMLQSFKGMFFVYWKSFWTVLTSIENILLATCVLWALIIKNTKKISREAIAIVVFVLVSAGLFQLVSPNYGSLVRYRVVYWFFVWWLVIEKIKPSLTSFFKVKEGLK